MSTREVGTNYEVLAEQYLKERGLLPLARNQRVHHAEIDLILKDGQYLVFVEVKYRRNQHFAKVLEQLRVSQLERIKYAARAWMASEKLIEHRTYCRFDLIIITGEPFHIEWFKDAF
ncbi:YraN family protein [Aliidiomarina iranensis]|nr:YraN family protein [Aliidiomarina iranensis]